MLKDVVHLGDMFRVGGAMVQVSEPRAPCAKLALKMGLPQFPKRFLASERVGFDLRVLREGEVGAGDVIEQVEAEPERMTVRQFVHLAYFDEGNREGVRRALRIRGLPPDWREWLEDVLAKAGTGSSEKRLLRGTRGPGHTLPSSFHSFEADLLGLPPRRSRRTSRCPLERAVATAGGNRP